MHWHEETVQGGGVQLFVRRVDDPPAPPVLLLHGLGVGGVIWQSFARRLLPQLAAVAPDLRGHGQSEAPAEGYSTIDYASDLVGLLSSLDQVEPPLPLVGHSLGAMVGLSLAELRPDLVSWLVLLDPPLDPSIANAEVPNVYRLRHALPGELEAYLLEHNPGGGELLARSLAKLFRQASDAAFEAMLDPSDLEGRPPPFAAQALDQAARVQQPVLVLQADPSHGGILGDAAAQAFVDRLPHGKLQKIPGATHALHASHPAQVAQAILDFGGLSQSSLDSSPDSV